MQLNTHTATTILKLYQLIYIFDLLVIFFSLGKTHTHNLQTSNLIKCDDNIKINIKILTDSIAQSQYLRKTTKKEKTIAVFFSSIFDTKFISMRSNSYDDFMAMMMIKR